MFASISMPVSLTVAVIVKVADAVTGSSNIDQTADRVVKAHCCFFVCLVVDKMDCMPLKIEKK